MAVAPTYPGVYVSETALVPHIVTPATTNLTAFIGIFPKGPVDRAELVHSWAAFAEIYGDLDADSSMAAYAVWQFFLNGGIGAWIVRLDPVGDGVTRGVEAASVVALGAPLPAGSYTLSAKNPGLWGNDLYVSLEPSGPKAAPSATHVDLTVSKPAPDAQQTDPANPDVFTAVETLSSLDATKPGVLAATINAQSAYVDAATADSGGTAGDGGGTGIQKLGVTTAGADAAWNSATFTAAVVAELAQGASLDRIAPQLFNIMCIPDLAWLAADDGVSGYAAALIFCAARRAFLIVDPPPPQNPGAPPPSLADAAPVPIPPVGLSEDNVAALVATWGGTFLNQSPNSAFGATYYPWIEIPDPGNAFLPRLVPPSGTVAGQYAATDENRGVWKAPAGTETALAGVTRLGDTSVNDEVNGELNIAGINCLRTFPNYGSVVWGARTLAGSTVGGNAFKYVPVRRLTDFIEQSLQSSLVWAVFEPNDAVLWASIQAEAGAFMRGLYGAGAFSGATADAAYHVVCDGTTTSPNDMLAGVVNLSVGFWPVDPAEFVVINVQLNAGPPAS